MSGYYYRSSYHALLRFATEHEFRGGGAAQFITVSSAAAFLSTKGL